MNSNQATKLSNKEIENFYSENLPDLPTTPNFRHYRIIMQNGNMLKINKHINNPYDLQKILIHQKPIAVYHTVSCWLHPETLCAKGKGSYKWLDNCFMWSDFVLDFDNPKPINITKAHSFLSKQYPNASFTLIQTGNGFHLHMQNWYNPPTTKSPFDRENMDLAQRFKLVKLLKSKRIKFDYNVSRDTRRLVRVCNTLHQNGTIIHKIPLTTSLRELNRLSEAMT